MTDTCSGIVPEVLASATVRRQRLRPFGLRAAAVIGAPLSAELSARQFDKFPLPK